MACEPNRARLLCMLSMTFGFFIVEVVVSRMTSSLSMLSDSFHMLSDVIALVVALVAVRFAEKTQATNKNTFGWIRAEVMGALVNAVFLTALCFTIVLEAVERFTEPHEIEGPLVVVGVGAAGLLVNLLGLCLFHGHAGGGHGHSHGGGGGGHSHGGKRAKAPKAGSCGEETNHLVNHNSPGDGHSDRKNELVCKDNTEVHVNGSPHYENLDAAPDSTQLNMHFEDLDTAPDSSQLNMRGVFLHVLGDALGSVIVVVTATIFYFVWTPCGSDENCVNPCINGHSSDHRHINHTIVDLLEQSSAVRMSGPCWVLYLDPVLCIIMVGILLYTTYPLLKESALILLQTVPKQINMDSLNERLLRLDGVLAIHELHIWQLAGSRIIATAHIKCQDPTSYMEVAKRIKDFFHNEGIHATTIQPEFVTFNSENRDSQCELACRTVCAPKQCCGNGEKADGKKNSVDNKMAGPNALEVISEMQEQPVQVGPRAEERREAESTL